LEVRVLRIHFTADDLLRIRVAPAADPLWEILLSLHRLQGRDGDLVFGPWRRHVRTRLQPGSAGRLAGEVLAPLMPQASYIPDFLTPAEGAGGLESGVEAVLRTPRRRLAAELSRLATTGVTPPGGAALARGEPAALTRVGRALSTYHEVVLAPHWEQIAVRVGADRSARIRVLADEGVESMLTTFDFMRWRPPVLEVDYPVDQELRLNGRGLTLVPSAFCWRRPVALADPGLPPVLVYPANPHNDWLASPDPRATPGGLAALIGPSRAAILHRLADKPCVNGELARLIATTPATVSKHTAVLRDAGLIVSLQRGRFVTHMLTPLGAALLDGTVPARDRGAS
jgi:DNA-binding transcriptional ArsR family regulator